MWPVARRVFLAALVCKPRPHAQRSIPGARITLSSARTAHWDHSALGYQPPANFAVAILAAQQSTGRTALSSNISPQGSKEPLNKSSVERVAGKIGMIPRRTPQVVAWSTRPRRATRGAPDFATTLRDGSFAGGLRCQARSEGDRPFASSPFVHPIPQSCRRARVVLVQRLLS